MTGATLVGVAFVLPSFLIGVELTSWPDPLDFVVVPLGNGALLSGIATWIRHVLPATCVVGVCAAKAPAMEQSWRARRMIRTAEAPTIADGIAIRVPIQEALDDLTGVVNEIALVTEADILRSMRFIHNVHGQPLEPAGAVGVAALLAGGNAYAGATVATVLCGANLTPEQRQRWFR